jgi:hypothetical protein
MASIFMWQTIPFLNIDATVGLGGVNNHEDVFLVQAILREVVGIYMELGESSTPIPTGTWSKDDAGTLTIYVDQINNNPRFGQQKSFKAYFGETLDPIQGSIYAYGTNHRWGIANMQELLSISIGNNCLRSCLEIHFCAESAFRK